MLFHRYYQLQKFSLPTPIFPNMKVISSITRAFWFYLIVPLLNLLLAVIAVRQMKTRFTICLASGIGSAIIGLILRKIGLVGKVIYWSVDWLPISRFRKDIGLLRILTFAYFQLMDRFCAEHCDATWDITKRIGGAREQLGNLIRHPIRYVNHEIVHPPIVDFTKRALRNKGMKKIKPAVVFIGRGLKEGEGIDLAIEGVRFLLNKGIEVELNIISGAKTNLQDRRKILNVIKRYKIEKYVTIHGYLSMAKVRQIMRNSFCGISIFKEKDHISNFAFPGKVLTYLESGLPVIVSKHSALAKDLSNANAGLAIDYRKDDFAEALINILKNESKFRLGVMEFVRTRLSVEEIIEHLLRIIP